MNLNKKLTSAPLKEVIFEISWEEDVDEFGNKIDLGFELAQGKFFQIIKPTFPIHKKLHNSSQLLEFGTPIHQYWSNELEWPVIQHGQGILTINQTEEKYLWEELKNLIIETLTGLRESYENEIIINKISLEYLDAFDMNEANSLLFIQEKLQTSIKTDYVLPGELTNIKISRNYVQNDGTQLNINISDAVNNLTSGNAVIMVTSATKERENISADFEKDLENLHSICSTVFKTILNKDYYGSLS